MGKCSATYVLLVPPLRTSTALSKHLVQGPGLTAIFLIFSVLAQGGGEIVLQFQPWMPIRYFRVRVTVKHRRLMPRRMTQVLTGGGGGGSSCSTQSCRTLYQDGEEMVKVVRSEFSNNGGI